MVLGIKPHQVTFKAITLPAARSLWLPKSNLKTRSLPIFKTRFCHRIIEVSDLAIDYSYSK